MSQLDEKLTQLLGDPAAMAQVMQLAQQLSGTLGEGGGGGAPPPTPPPPPPPPPDPPPPRRPLPHRRRNPPHRHRGRTTSARSTRSCSRACCR